MGAFESSKIAKMGGQVGKSTLPPLVSGGHAKFPGGHLGAAPEPSYKYVSCQRASLFSLKIKRFLARVHMLSEFLASASRVSLNREN